MPHADFAGLAQAVTFRLADALPESVLQRLRAAVVEDKPSSVAGQRQDALLAERIHAWLDAGHGSCCRMRSVPVMVLSTGWMRW